MDILYHYLLGWCFCLETLITEMKRQSFEQEATDAFVELQVYMLQQKYGDEWKEHCKPSVLYYYNEMMKRQQQSSLSGDAPGVEHPPPPGTEAI
jgi:hypothetical protein